MSIDGVASIVFIDHSGSRRVKVLRKSQYPSIGGQQTTLCLALREFIKQKDKYGYAHMNIPSGGGIQQMLSIPLKKLNGWLFSINPAKVRADIRERLIHYQEECFSVLHDYWTKGQVTNPRKAKKALPGKLTPEQQEAIKQLMA